MSTYIRPSVTTAPSSKPCRPRTRTNPTTLQWSRLDAFVKLGAAYERLCDHGGMLLTLRLSDTVQAAACHRGDAARYICRRIQAEFRRSNLQLPRLAFCLEVTQDGRDMLHVHGVIEIPDGRLAERTLALRRAGGLVAGPAAARQLHLQPSDARRGGARGWADYTRKAVRRTRKVIGNDRITYIERRLLQDCARDWEERRRRSSMSPS